MCAPSVDDERPWHFAIIKNDILKNEIGETWPLAQVVKDAPLAIIVCGDELLQKQQNCWMIDCAAATENILIESQFIGLGAAWLAVYPVEGRIQRIRTLLNAPKSIIPFSIVPIGYPAETKEPVSRYNENRIHNQTW
jgi:nitroreductase